MLAQWEVLLHEKAIGDLKHFERHFASACSIIQHISAVAGVRYVAISVTKRWRRGNHQNKSEKVKKGHVAQTNKTIDLFPRGQNGGSEWKRKMVSLAKLKNRGVVVANTRGLLLIFCLQLHVKSGDSLKISTKVRVGWNSILPSLLCLRKTWKVRWIKYKYTRYTYR